MAKTNIKRGTGDFTSVFSEYLPRLETWLHVKPNRGFLLWTNQLVVFSWSIGNYFEKYMIGKVWIRKAFTALHSREPYYNHGHSVKYLPWCTNKPRQVKFICINVTLVNLWCYRLDHLSRWGLLRRWAKLSWIA